MVAAWISADTGVGPSIASSSQDCSGSCADLPHAPSSSSSPSAVDHAVAGPAHRVPNTPVNVTVPNGREHQHDGQGQPGVADPVGDERLLGRGRGGGLVLPEPDQQVGGQAHALPARVQGQVVVGQHQQQHRGQEQVHVAEEPAPLRVVRHVADREDVDQRADAGDQQHEADRQRVEQQADAHLEAGRPGSRSTGAGPGCAGRPGSRASRRTRSRRTRTPRPAWPRRPGAPRSWCASRRAAGSRRRPGGRPAAATRRAGRRWRPRWS